MTAHFHFTNCRGSRIIRIVKKLFVGKTAADTIKLEMEENACGTFDALSRIERQNLIIVFVDIQRRTFDEFLRDIRPYTDPSDIQSYNTSFLSIRCNIRGLDLTFGWMRSTQILHLLAIKVINDNFDPDDGPGDGTMLFTRSAAALTTDNILLTPDDDLRRRIFVMVASEWKSIEREQLYELYDIPVTEIFADSSSIDETLNMLSKRGYQYKIESSDGRSSVHSFKKANECFGLLSGR